METTLIRFNKIDELNVLKILAFVLDAKKEIYIQGDRMKNYLKRTLLFGIAEGVFLFIFIRSLFETISYNSYRLLNPVSLKYYNFYLNITILIMLVIIINLVMFIILEISPRKNSDNLNSKSQVWDKILLYVLLTLSSIGLPSIWLAIDSYLHPAMWDFSLFLFGPIALFYGVMVFVIFLRLYRGSFPTNNNGDSVENITLRDGYVTTENHVATKFDFSQPLAIATIGCGIAGIIYAIGTLLSPTLFIWFFYPLGDYISGMTITFALGQLIPSIRSNGIQIVLGFMIGSILDLLIGHPFYYSSFSAATNPFITQFMWNFFNIIAASITMSVVIGKISKGSSGRVFVYWLFANVLQNLFYVAQKNSSESFTMMGESFVGMAIFGVVGCYLTLKNIQKSISNFSLNTQE